MTKVLSSQKSALKFLASVQQANGSFLSYSSQDPNLFKSALTFQTTFSSSLILQVLNQLPSHSNAQKISSALATFLLSEKSNNWTWNYWQRQSPEATSLAYPDDLDDTFCATTALQLYDPELINPPALSHLIKVLTFCEQQAGGPYQTWVVSQEASPVWRDIDCVVNANIAFFLKKQNIFLPRLTQLLEQTIRAQNFSSPYYPSVFATIYFISRSYQGPLRSELKKKIWALTESNNSWNTPLQTALAISSLLQLGEKKERLEPAVRFLLQTQRSDGSWPIETFYTGVNPQRDAKFFAGSAALSTAFCLEAITHYNQLPAAKTKLAPVKKNNSEYSRILNLAKQRLMMLSEPLREVALRELTKIQQIDRDQQIVLLPYVFNKQLRYQSNEDQIDKLCLANVFGWMAYSIYDDFWDNEAKPVELGCANVALRFLTELYQDISREKPAIYQLFSQIMDKLDWANTWEISHCRLEFKKDYIDLDHWASPDFGDYHTLAAKSMGHALGPLSLLLLNNVEVGSSQFQNLKKFFEHYIIARQLNDDAHDVFKDLGKGHITAVNSLLITDWQKKTSQTLLNVKDLHLKSIFWDTTIIKVSELILSQCQIAQKIANKLENILQPEFVNALIEPLEKATYQALNEHQHTQAFLTQYLK